MAHLPAYDCSLALHKKARVVLRPLDNQCHHCLPLFNCLPNQILTISVEPSVCLIALFRHAICRHKVDSLSTWICLSAIVHVCITKWWPIAMPSTLAPLLIGNLSRPRPFSTGHYTHTDTHMWPHYKFYCLCFYKSSDEMSAAIHRISCSVYSRVWASLATYSILIICILFWELKSSWSVWSDFGKYFNGDLRD